MKSKVAAAPPGSWGRRLGFASLAFFFAAGALRLYYLVLPQSFVRSALVAEAIVHGEPPWRIFQSRVLGSYLVHAISVLTHLSPPEAYAYAALAILFAAGLGVLVLTERLRDPQRPALASFLIFQAGFMLLLPCIWLYVWDVISLVVFAFFNYYVMRGTSRRALAILFLIGMLNHEITIFIAAWMVLDPIVKHFSNRGTSGARAAFDRATMLLGLVLTAVGIAVVVTLRRVLLVREMPPPDSIERAGAHGGDFRFALAENWDSMVHSFTLSPAQSYQFVVPLFLIAVAILAIRLAIIDRARFGALAIVMLAMIASFLCFGLVLETRVLQPLVPFIAMHGWTVVRGRGATAA